MRYSFEELVFGPKLSPIGMGEVRIAPGPNQVTLFSVAADDILILRLYGKPEPFQFKIYNGVLRLRHLTGRAFVPRGVQVFAKASALTFSE